MRRELDQENARKCACDGAPESSILPPMSVCPFCKAPVSKTNAPCPRCGRLASEHPSIASVGGRNLSTDFDDEPLEDLVLDGGHAGASGATRTAGHAASYDGGGVTFDDDLFGDGPGAPLELDVPNAPASDRGAPAVPTSGAMPVSGERGAADPFDSVPDMPAPASSRGGAAAAPIRPSGAHPMPGTSGTLPAARPHAHPESSDPRLGAPPASHPGLPASSGELPAAPESDPAASERRPAPPPPDPGAVLVARYPAPPSGVFDMPGYFCRVFLRQIELRRDLESLRRRRSPDVALYEAALRAHDGRAYGIGLAITATAVVLGTLVFFSPVIARFLSN